MTQNTETIPTHQGDGPDDGTREAARPAQRKPWWRNQWVLPMALIAAGFLIYQLPPYLTFDYDQSRIPPRNHLHYALLMGHVLFGSVALITMCMQLWPWLRRTHPVVHRWSGRVYIFGGALPSALCAVAMFPVIPSAGSMGVVTSAVLWSVCAVVGFRMARQRRYAEHRRWMLYSFAIVWGQVIWGFIAGNIWLRWTPWADTVDFTYIVEAVRWVGWVANLIVVQWWLERTSGRPLKLPNWERQPTARERQAATR